MAALRWAALNLWSSHDTARDDPPAAKSDDESHETSASESDESHETSASESDDSVTRSLPPLEAPTTLDGAAFRPPLEPNVDDAAGAWDLHDEPECPVCLEPWAVAARVEVKFQGARDRVDGLSDSSAVDAIDATP